MRLRNFSDCSFSSSVFGFSTSAPVCGQRVKSKVVLVTPPLAGLFPLVPPTPLRAAMRVKPLALLRALRLLAELAPFAPLLPGRPGVDPGGLVPLGLLLTGKPAPLG